MSPCLTHAPHPCLTQHSAQLPSWELPAALVGIAHVGTALVALAFKGNSP